jgi:hypothetical protein
MLSNVPKIRSSRFHNYAPWLNVVFGLLVFVLRYSSPRGTFAVHWNLFLSGLVIMFAAFASTIAHDGNSSRNYWSVINIAAGVWLLISVKMIPSVLQVTVAQTALGALVIAVAVVSLATEVLGTRAKRQTRRRSG